MNTSSMDMTLTSVQYSGNQADAMVSFTTKGGDPSQGMPMEYKLELRNSKWVVIGRQDVGAPHGSSMPPGAAVPGAAGGTGATPGAQNPHGGQMPAPENLPPAGKKE